MENIAQQSNAIAKVVSQQLNKNREAIMRSLPKGFNYDRMCRAAINAIATTPAIAECTTTSIFLSTIKAFTLGLEPNGALAEGYLIPFTNKGIKTAVFMPSYRGLINIARRSGDITTLYAASVFENDNFKITLGDDKRLEHEPDMFSDRGDTNGYYAAYKTKTGDIDFEVMTIDEIEKVRNTSKAKDSGPWRDWYDEMAKKTVIKRLLKRAPMSIELAGAVQADHVASTGELKNDDIIDIEGMEIEPDKHYQEPQSTEQQPQQQTQSNQQYNPTGKEISEAQGKRLYAITMQSGKSTNHVVNHIKKHYGYMDTAHIQYDKYEEICDWVEGK